MVILLLACSFDFGVGNLPHSSLLALHFGFLAAHLTPDLFGIGFAFGGVLALSDFYLILTV